MPSLVERSYLLSILDADAASIYQLALNDEERISTQQQNMLYEALNHTPQDLLTEEVVFLVNEIMDMDKVLRSEIVALFLVMSHLSVDTLATIPEVALLYKKIDSVAYQNIYDLLVVEQALLVLHDLFAVGRSE